jgi:hypothetical protein
LSGANGVLTFIDDSNQTLGALTANSRAGRVFNVVSGSITTVSGSVTASTNAKTWGTNGPGYGLVYPDLGVIVLNPNAICPAVGFYVSGATALTTASGSAYNTGSTYIGSASLYTNTTIATLDSTAYIPFAPLTASLSQTAWNSEKAAFNQSGLFTSLRNAIRSSAYEFRARSAETISSMHFYVRLRNREYNYSNNPTFRNPDNNTLIQADFKTNPKVYPTTIGLYNDRNECLAVAKLSKPLPKSYSEEALIKVRLDF